MDSGDCSPPPGSLCVDQTVIYDLYCPVPDVVHPLHPQHLILRLELFGDALTLCHLFYQQEHLLRRLLVDVVKVGIQPAAGQQFRVQGFALCFDVLQVPPAPNTDRFLLLSRYCQIGETIVAPQFVPS